MSDSQCWEGERALFLCIKRNMKNISIFSRPSHSWFKIGKADERYRGGFYLKRFQIHLYGCGEGPSIVKLGFQLMNKELTVKPLPFIEHLGDTMPCAECFQ